MGTLCSPTLGRRAGNTTPLENEVGIVRQCSLVNEGELPGETE